MFDKKHPVLSALLFATLALLACSLFSTPNPTPVPIEPMDKPASTLAPVLPTATPVPIIAQANSTFTGLMTISSQGKNASAKGGEIEFKISLDGTAIVSLSYSLFEGKCSYVSGSSTTTISGSSKSTLFFTKPVPITNGKFLIDFMGIRAKGNLNSPTEAYGEITINKEETMTSTSNQKFTCQYGTWTWTASVK